MDSSAHKLTSGDRPDTAVSALTSGQLLLWVSSTDGHVYVTGSDGVDRKLAESSASSLIGLDEGGTNTDLSSGQGVLVQSTSGAAVSALGGTGILKLASDVPSVAALVRSEMPSGTLGVGVSLDSTLRAVGDGTTNSPLFLSNDNFKVEVVDAGFLNFEFFNQDADGTLTLLAAAGSNSTPTNNAYFGMKAYGEAHPSWADYCDVLAVNSAKLRFRAIDCDIEFANNTTPLVTIDTSGKVGIGVTSPSVPLEVAGAAKMTDDIMVNGLTVGRGAGGDIRDTAVGYSALNSSTTGIRNTAVGYSALYSCTTGGFNSAFGYNALTSNTTGVKNTAVGHNTLTSNTTGQSNTAVGQQAGRYAGSGETLNETSSECIYIGFRTRSGADGRQRENVIGYADIIGSGNNTTTIGEKPVFPDMPTSSAGLPSGALWCDTSDSNRIKMVS